MKVLVTGAAGQVGRELVRARWSVGTELVALDRAGLDITDEAAVHTAMSAIGPDLIVNAAAYTAVDKAEDEPELAEAVNNSAVGHLANAAEKLGARLIHVSTDYVFDGTKDGWYTEADAICPIGVYGTTKARGENAARRTPRHLILRSAWVYGALGGNFVVTMLGAARNRPELRVVDDQVGCPSSALDIATAITELAAESPADELTGTYHLAGPQQATWYEFACAVLAEEMASGQVSVQPITTAEYPTRARRPPNSRLDSSALSDARDIRLHPWSEAMPRVVDELRSLESG